jgi:hypothetical protein
MFYVLRKKSPRSKEASASYAAQIFIKKEKQNCFHWPVLLEVQTNESSR